MMFRGLFRDGPQQLFRLANAVLGMKARYSRPSGAKILASKVGF